MYNQNYGGQFGQGGNEGWGSGAGGLGQLGFGLAGLFGLGKGRNPSDIANQELNKIPGQTKQYYDPYMQAGQGALGSLQNQYADLLGGNTQNKLGESYKESPGYQRALQQALQGGSAAAAQGGLLGTPAHQEQNMELASGIASKDYNNYLQNQIGLFGQGLQGQQGLNQMGFNANTDFGNLLANIQQQKAGYGYQGQNAQNQSRQQDWQNIFGGAGAILPWLR